MADGAMEQTILTAISAVGFPIVVTFYLLTRFQRSMDKFTEQIGELVKELQLPKACEPMDLSVDGSDSDESL